jgi:hypothetical protein
MGRAKTAESGGGTRDILQKPINKSRYLDTFFSEEWIFGRDCGGVGGR